MLMTLIAFIVALGVLVAVHEWGHYRMAVACNVKVLRFSVGFGPPLLRFKPKRQRPGQDTEYVLAALPLGGYVKMLDEREAPVPEALRHRAFNTQPLKVRALIVAAGPVANLLLAVALYTLVNWIGVAEPRAILSPPLAGSLAEQAGLQGGDLVETAALGAQAPQPVASFENLRWLLTRGALDGQALHLQVRRDGAPVGLTLPLAQLPSREPDTQMFRAIGIVSPLSLPLIGQVQPGGAAEHAGLRAGDRVRSVGDTPMHSAQQLRDWIRNSPQTPGALDSVWHIERDGQRLQLPVRPQVTGQGPQAVGRIGAVVGSPPDMVTVRQGPLQGLVKGAQRVWEISSLSLKLLGRMLVGELSLKSLSGPIAIADYAGKSAALGLTYYLAFMAFISVSLGVLNLLPVPVLDGGHLLYYLWEGVTGRPLAEAWQQRLQYVGAALLLTMMALAVYNDLAARIG